MLTIYLLRHGETRWNAEGNKYCGRTDLPLTEKGIGQAEAVRQKLKAVKFDAIYASPLKRALQTAQIVSGKTEVYTDSRLQEVDFGLWEGKPKEVFIPENKALWQSWITDPTHVQAGATGETAGAVVERVNAFFQALVADRQNETILVAGHNGVNRLFLSYKLEMPLRNYQKFFLDNASVTIFTLDERNAMVLRTLNK